MASAIRLLAQARDLYDNPNLPFANAAQQEAWQDSFQSGAEWMALVMVTLRQQELPVVTCSFHQLGWIKYSLAVIGAILFLMGVLALKLWLLVPVTILIFYAIEVQMVFLFPLALDGSLSPFRESLQWTRKAGGTLSAMLTVIPLAVVMLFGGWVGQGFIRSWSLGCLAVVLWYEELRHEP